MIQSANASVYKHELKKSLKEEDVSGISDQLEEFKNKYSLQLME